MKTIRKVEVTPIWLDELMISFDDMKENTLYISIKYNTVIHKCLCGCGNESVIPLTRDGWFLTDVENKVTLTPSILNTNCPNKSHYIINKNIANFV